MPTATAEGKTRTTLYLSPDLWKMIRRVAVEKDTTATGIVEQALEDWLKKHNGKPTK